MTAYDIIYIMSNTFATYIIFKLMNLFFDRKGIKKTHELLSYVLYFVTISAIYIIYDTPVLNLITNFILFFVITLNYKTTLKHRLLAILYIYLILMSAETIVVLTFNALNVNDLSIKIDLGLVLSLITSKILSYVIVLIFTNLKKLKSNISISPIHWIAVVFVPVTTLFSTIILTVEKYQINNTLIFISIGSMFFINIMIFYLYDSLIKSYDEKMEKNHLEQQKAQYQNQLNLIMQSQENFSILKHDMNAHLLALKGLYDNNQSVAAADYISKMLEVSNNTIEYAKSGNLEIDTLLNYKLQIAKNLNISTDIELSIPDKLNIHSYDLMTIIGNLLDNAIEATLKVKENKHIKIKIRFDKNLLYIFVSNPFNAELIINEKMNIITTKRDKSQHGYGFISINKALEKYNGTMNIDHSDNIFKVSLMLYNSP